jgi:hypothetical protein
VSLVSHQALAVEIYSLYTKTCTNISGALVSVDEEYAHVLGLNGSIEKLRLEEIELIARYNTLENPFPNIHNAKEREWMFAVLSRSDKKMFNAYVTSFFEDLVLFLDEEGRIRVVELRDIIALKDVKPTTSKITPTYSPALLNSPPGRLNCPAVQSKSQGNKRPHVPTVVMSDKLRLDSFFARQRAGYRALRSLKERTMFYSRPILFDQKSRLGLLYRFPSGRSERLGLNDGADEAFPLYLEFGGGDAYRFQSSTSFGASSWHAIPQIQPIFAVRSEFKSHLLHGLFMGNFSGFAAGSSLFGNRWTPDKRVYSKKVWFTSSFNHLTLLGADYGPFSVSYGYYFPVFALGKSAEYREIVPSNSSPVFRIGYTKERWLWELFFFNTYSKGELDTDISDLKVDSTREDVGNLYYYSARFVPQIAKIKSYTIRTNFRYQWTRDLVMQTDLLHTNATFHETAFRRDTAIDFNEAIEIDNLTEGSQSENHIEFKETAMRLQLRMDMGQWVALKGEAQFQHWNTKGAFYESLDAESESHTDQLTSFLAALELLL